MSQPITTEAYVARGPSSPTTSDGLDHLRLEPVRYDGVGAREVLVELVAVGVCHSDVRAAQGTFHMKPPMVPGHEGAGIVRMVGSEVEKGEAGRAEVKVGDSVVLSYASCGRCQRCLRGRAPYCTGLWDLNFGGGRVGAVEGGEARSRKDEATMRDADGKGVKNFFFGQSSMARLVLARVESVVKVDVTGREELKMLAPLGCGVQTGAGAILNVLNPPPHSAIAIWGAGAVGLSACLAARLTSPSHLIIVDTSEVKLKMIPSDFATHLVNASSLSGGEVAAQIQEITGGRGLDYAIDAVGSGAVLAMAHDALATTGTLMTLGGSTETPQFPIERHLVKGITYRGSHQGDSVPKVMIPKLIELWRQGKFPFDKLLSFFPFTDLGRALQETKAGKVIKPVLVVED